MKKYNVGQHETNCLKKDGCEIILLAFCFIFLDILDIRHQLTNVHVCGHENESNKFYNNIQYLAFISIAKCEIQ